MESLENNKSKHIEFVSAAAAVYAWISVADGEVTNREFNGFREYLNKLDYVSEISQRDFYEAYSKLLGFFEKDFDKGHEQAKIRIEKFKGRVKESEDLIRVARKALIADENYNDVEENVMSQIAQILSIDESSVAE